MCACRCVPASDNAKQAVRAAMVHAGLINA